MTDRQAPNADLGAPLDDPLDLLSKEAREALHADLAEMARLRRKAEADCAHLVIGAALQRGRAMSVACDPTKESRLSPIPHDYVLVGEEYGSLGDGGSYDVLRCRKCGRVAYSAMAD